MSNYLKKIMDTVWSDGGLNTGPLGDQTTFDHSNTRLVPYSDPTVHSTLDVECFGVKCFTDMIQIKF